MKQRMKGDDVGKILNKRVWISPIM